MKTNNKDLPKYPLYIVSKGRSDTRFTSKALEAMKVPYYIIIEKQEYDAYAQHISPEKILILPEHYFDDYDVYDDLGRTKSTGPGPARNFAWDHSMANGFTRHWVMDDNISMFLRMNNNLKLPANTGAIFRAMEDFCDRYENVGMAGPNYFMFAPRKAKVPPFVMNTRIYSCNLIKNDIPFRWRGRYNEDTDLSLRILKQGYCTIQFNAFLQLKIRTQVVKGGNTAEFYEKEGTLPKSKMLVEMHPDVSKVVWKFQRWHHVVDYTPFKNIKLRPITEISIDTPIDNYGMELKYITKKK